MDWSDVGSFVGKAAPLVGTLLGGPAVGAVAGMVAAKLGVEPTPDAVNAALTSDPDALLKIRQLEADHETRFQEIALEQTKADYADMADARNREVQLKDATPKVLAYLITAGFFGVLAILIFRGMPEHGAEALLVLLGSLGTAWIAVISYYYGSTKGSTERNTLLAKAAISKS